MTNRYGKVAVFFLLLVAGLSAPVKAQRDSLLTILDVTISSRPKLLGKKYSLLDSLRNEWRNAASDEDCTSLLLQLSQEYQSFQFDTAYLYNSLLLDALSGEPDSVMRARAKVDQAFILLSGGFFQEALDSLGALDAAKLPDSLKVEYFYNLARAGFDLTDLYDDRQYGPVYYEQGMDHLDSAITYADPSGWRSLSLRGLQAMKLGNIILARDLYDQLVSDPRLPDRQLAIEASSKSYVFELLRMPEKAMESMIVAAIADERNCVKETTALMKLADYLYQAGDFERSDQYISLALGDANYYSARLRKAQILEVLPLIKARQVALSEEKRRQWLVFSILLSGLLVICVYLILSNIRKNRALRASEQRIREAYLELERSSKALLEADRIKETYIGHFFAWNTSLIRKMNKLWGNVRKSVAEHNLQDAQYQLKQFNARREQKKLLDEFDQAFLRVFPSFVDSFNQLFPPDHQYAASENGLLNTELRIFALIRLGVRNNELIARALDYSVNTIYTYKTKVRNRSILSNDAFDRALMEITGIEGE